MNFSNWELNNPPSIVRFFKRLRFLNFFSSYAKIEKRKTEKIPIPEKWTLGSGTQLYIQVLGNSGKGCSRSVYVYTNDTRYLFNCGEGTANIALEFRIELAKVEHFFCTYKSWNNLGGLPGLILTLDTLGINQVTFHGPPDFEKICNMTKGFVMNSKLKIVKKNPSDLYFEDDSLAIQYVSLVSDCSEKTLDGENEVKKSLGVSYICKVKSEIYTETQKCPVFIVVECPKRSFLKSLTTNKEFLEIKNSVDLIIHFTSSEVMEDSRYIKWMNSFDSKTFHLLVNDYNTGPDSQAVYRLQTWLNLFNLDVFPNLAIRSEVNRLPLSNNQIISGETLLRIYLYPQFIIDRKFCIPSKVTCYTTEIEEFIKINKILHQEISLEKITSDNNYPEIFFLGTGATIGQLNRNNSSILLNIGARQSILLDCGEATFIQLHRYYGDKLDFVLQNISMIFISHLHIDHYMGLVKILLERKRLQKLSTLAPVILISPFNLKVFLKHYSEQFENLQGTYKLLCAATLIKKNDMTFDYVEYSHLCDALSLIDFEVIPVIHCKNAFGMSLTCLSGFKIVFSGDTRPCDKIINSGFDCDLLIHDATFENEEADKAIITKHCTTEEAILVGKQSQAKFLLLSHFNHYYPRLPHVHHFPQNIGVAFDFMKITPKDLLNFNNMLPCLKEVLVHYHSLLEKEAEERLHLMRMRQRQVQEMM